MIYVHTFRVDDDYCQFHEYEPNDNMRVIDSPDLPIALLFPKSQYARGYMRHLVKHYYPDSHISYFGTSAFDEYDFAV